MKNIVVIGNGMVGNKYCEKLINSSVAGDYQITVLGEEPRPAYDRVHLSEYFENESEENLTMAPMSWYADHNIDIGLNELVTEINRKDKKVTTHSGRIYPYDKLVIATGSSPFVPPIPGSDLSGVYVYRTIEDLEGMLSYGKGLVRAGGRAAILGGGLLGLEAAKAAMDMGLEAHVVEFADRLMPRQLDRAGSATLQRILEEIGIHIHLSKNTKEITGDGRIEKMTFADGSELSVDMLIISAGIRPRDELASTAELSRGPRGGIVVNQYMQTDDPDIYAIGEVACYQEMCYGLVAPGYEMAQVAVDHLSGFTTEMSAEVDMSTKLKLIGVDVASFGDALDMADQYVPIVIEDRFNNVYQRVNICPETQLLKGGILVGDAEQYNTLLQICQNEMSLGEHPEEILLGSGGGAEIGLADLPDEAVICACESVTKGNICCAVQDQDCHSVKTLSASTKATTGCGGCKPMVADLLEHTLKSMGIVQKKVLCEHFDYSRRELYDIIKFKEIKNYDQLLAEYGKGLGCETCQPAVASMFASIYNETAVKQETIQDTNDRFLANIQRNGSYSVVPRVPGGEITPDRLIVIGEVAKKYDLYTKITGGQRIDLFGARLDDLPAIWSELIAAGFESGHAYGKALRTVKSCVGSTWCRYGMDESVSFAIELENRYKGIRSPHKMKGGVSGCIRECAEARCKDFGVIATEHGWNLYVCGNGGATPRHAELLAEGIDNETCIRYIDRFLMYYIRTAAPLQRTAAWLDKLEGGIAYLKQVVVDDILGISADLEAEMQGLVDSYECEWKQVVDSPKLQERFQHFINSDEGDEHMAFVPMRDQKMPTPWK